MMFDSIAEKIRDFRKIVFVTGGMSGRKPLYMQVNVI